MAHVSLITLGVADLEGATRFYEAMGWHRSSASVEGVVAFLRGGARWCSCVGIRADHVVPSRTSTTRPFRRALEPSRSQERCLGGHLGLQLRVPDAGAEQDLFGDAPGVVETQDVQLAGDVPTLVLRLVPLEPHE